MILPQCCCACLGPAETAFPIDRFDDGTASGVVQVPMYHACRKAAVRRQVLGGVVAALIVVAGIVLAIMAINKILPFVFFLCGLVGFVVMKPVWFAIASPPARFEREITGDVALWSYSFAHKPYEKLFQQANPLIH